MILHRGKKAASLVCKLLSFEFRAHDLRRTAATRMAEAGVTREHLARVLNHIEGGPRRRVSTIGTATMPRSGRRWSSGSDR